MGTSVEQRRPAAECSTGHFKGRPKGVRFLIRPLGNGSRGMSDLNVCCLCVDEMSTYLVVASHDREKLAYQTPCQKQIGLVPKSPSVPFAISESHPNLTHLLSFFPGPAGAFCHCHSANPLGCHTPRHLFGGGEICAPPPKKNADKSQVQHFSYCDFRMSHASHISLRNSKM